MKPKLLIIELWGVGDLVIATPFLRAAADRFAVTLIAKPFASDLQVRFWPGVEVLPFDAPWTVFRNKYHVWRWPLGRMERLRQELAERRFDVGVSARWDPRDHLVLKLAEVRRRLGFPRAGSRNWLTDPLARPEPAAHRYEYWRILARELGMDLPARERFPVGPRGRRGQVIVHSGARLPARIWPLENYRRLLARIRGSGWEVKLLADDSQTAWWRKVGEQPVVPRSVSDLCVALEDGDVFVGNCSGPGHLAAILGLPTFTLFGASLPEWFLPLHPQAEYLEGPACPFRPCSDYCRFDEPRCLTGLQEEWAWQRIRSFLERRAPLGRLEVAVDADGSRPLPILSPAGPCPNSDNAARPVL